MRLRLSASLPAAVGAALLAAACAGTPPPHGAPSTARRVPPRTGEVAPVLRPNPPVARNLSLADLPGWADEDHAAAFAAFAQGCGASREVPMRDVCAEARRAGRLDEGQARRFFETRFRPAPLEGEGVLTAYFAPEYEARDQPGGPFTAPVRPRPSPAAFVYAAAPPPAAPPVAPPPVFDAPPAVADPADPVAALLGDPAAAQSFAIPSDDPPPAYAPPAYAQPPPVRLPLASADRAAIDGAPAPDALAWMRPEDLFFLQVQGSGVLDLPDGRRMKVTYAGDNGRPFTAIARPMVRAGYLAPAHASGDAIRAWLAAHAGPDAARVMAWNARYVFFAQARDDGIDPVGAAGVPLPAGRAIAVDPSRHGYGELYWIDAEAPVLAGAAKRYRRLAVSLDTGSAIRGDMRADLYIGRGAEAGREAGHVRHTLRLVRLIPVGS